MGIFIFNKVIFSFRFFFSLRVLDFWLGYLRQKDEHLSKFYSSGAILVHANKALKKQYDDLLVSIQRLAVLPFHMDTVFIKEKALTDSKLKSHDMIGSSDGGSISSTNQSYALDFPANQTLKAQTSVLELTATKALNWLTNATMTKRKSPSDLEDLSSCQSRSETIESTNPMTDSDSTADQMTGSLSFDEDEVDCPTQIQKFENLTGKQQQVYKDAKISSVDCDPIILPSDSLRSSQGSQAGFVSLFSNMAARFGENQSGQQSLTASMTSSASSLVTRLTGIQFGSTQKTYKRGVTEYKFAEDAKSDKTSVQGKQPENVAENKDHTEETVAKDTVDGEVKLRAKKADEASENRNSKRVSFDIVNLFDKLLLPASKPEKKDVKPVSRIPVPTNRWSWSFGISKPNTSTKMPKASTDTDLQTTPKKTAVKSESKGEHFPKRNNKVTNEKLSRGGKSVKVSTPSRGTTNVSAPPKPPRLVQSAPSSGRKSSETQSRNTATL